MRWFLIVVWLLLLILDLVMFFITGHMIDLFLAFMALAFIIYDLLILR